MAAKKNKTLFDKLTSLFKSGPVVKRKIRNIDTVIASQDPTSSGTLLLRKSSSPTYATITANAYNLSERLMRYQDFNEMEYCLHADTKIAIPGGYLTIGELAEECKKNPEHTFVVYSFDHNLGRIVPALGKQARQTRVDEAYVVTFDNGKKIIGTSNHRLMKRDGTFCKIEDLNPGDSMMPFYRRDLFNGNKEEGEGYRWIYTMDRRSKTRGWTTEHRLLGEMIKGQPLASNEVVRHVNFVKHDNRVENLRVMTDVDHKTLHAKIINSAKWSENNSAWIENFKKNHSKFMLSNNPTTRRDITFGRILEISERVMFNSKKLCEVLDTDLNVVKRHLRKNGYKDFQTFAKAYNPDWKNAGWENRGSNNPRYHHEITFDKICSCFSKNMKLKDLIKSLKATKTVVLNRLKERGFKNFKDFSKSFDNLKVVSVEHYGTIPLYDLTVDGYKNFATDTVISHNTPEISSALDIYADEICSQDDKGRILHIYSENEKIKEILEDLFYNVINCEFNLRSWARNLPVHKDTIIPLLDGRDISIEDLSREIKDGKDVWVYSVQDTTKKIVPGKVSWCDLTRKNSDIIRVWLDDNSYVDTAPDHKFTLRDMSTKEAQNLLPGDSLMPFYREIKEKGLSRVLRGYEKIYDPSTNKYHYTHRIMSQNLTRPPLRKGKWLVIHHKDFDKRNNSPENLVFMDESDHLELHREIAVKNLQTPEVSEKRRRSLDKWLRSGKRKKFAREHLKNLQEKGLMKNGWEEYNSSDKAKKDNKARSLRMKLMWSEKKVTLSNSLEIKFDEKCANIILRKIEEIGTYLGPRRLGKILLSDEEFMNYFRSINKEYSRKLEKTILSYSGINNLFRKIGFNSYINFIKNKSDIISRTPWFVRAYNKHLNQSGNDVFKQYRNHKVERVEFLSEKSDVYCMEVLGPDGEHDRHRFMTLSKKVNEDGSIETNLSGICLENCKYGDFFLYNDVSPEHGVVSAFPIPVNEIEREEGYDKDDPLATRFRWVSLGNRILENWEVSHFRLLGNDMFLPYGASVIESARRIWRQLILIEDAMLVYRVVRAPERRVFYVDVGNLPPNEIPMYIEEQRKNLRTNQVIDNTTGRVDLRYNPLSVDEDYILPVRGSDSGTKIETLAGGQNTSAVEDVEYIQKKLFSALKIPKAYLGYDEALSSKATLAQEDIRFSRTIGIIQKIILSELNKLAIIHLFAHGYDGEDLQNFVLRLSNPSTIAQQQKLDLWRTKFEIAGSAPEGFVNKNFVRTEIWGLTKEECNQIDELRLKDRLVDQTIENATPDVEEGGGGGGGGGGGFDLGGGGDDLGGDDIFGDEGGGEEDIFGDEEGGEEPSGGEDDDLDLTSGPEPVEDSEDVELLLSSDDVSQKRKTNQKGKTPISPQQQLKKILYNRSRIKNHGPLKNVSPDLGKIVSKQQSISDPYDSDWFDSYVSNPFGESYLRTNDLPQDIVKTLKRWSEKHEKISSNLLNENSGDELFIFDSEED